MLADIQSGRFARDWMSECAAGQPNFKAARRLAADHPVEALGVRLRAMMAGEGEEGPVERAWRED